MEGQPNSTNGVSKIERISYMITTKLGRSHEVNRISTRSYKNIHSNRPSKKLDQKRYRSFRISKNIGQRVF